MESKENQAADQAQPEMIQQPQFNYDAVKQNILFVFDRAYKSGAFQMDEVPGVIELKHTLTFFVEDHKIQGTQIDELKAKLEETEKNLCETRQELADSLNAKMEVVKDDIADKEPATEEFAKAMPKNKRRNINDIDVNDAQDISNHVPAGEEAK